MKGNTQLHSVHSNEICYIHFKKSCCVIELLIQRDTMYFQVFLCILTIHIRRKYEISFFISGLLTFNQQFMLNLHDTLFDDSRIVVFEWWVYGELKEHLYTLHTHYAHI